LKQPFTSGTCLHKPINQGAHNLSIALLVAPLLLQRVEGDAEVSPPIHHDADFAVRVVYISLATTVESGGRLLVSTSAHPG
jgi:hypothetical protein